MLLTVIKTTKGTPIEFPYSATDVYFKKEQRIQNLIFDEERIKP